MATWPKRFPDLATAQQYERNPEKLANYVYANRLGNSDQASGDGWRFRGCGPIQITGRENYQKYGSRLNVDLINHSDQAASPKVGFRIAGLYWRENGLNELADGERFETITKRINGGLKGLEDRLKYFVRAKQVLGVPATRGLRLPESELDLELPPAFTRGREALEKEASVERERTPRTRGAAFAPAVMVKKKTAGRNAGPQKAARKKAVQKQAGTAKAANRKPSRRQAARTGNRQMQQASAIPSQAKNN